MRDYELVVLLHPDLEINLDKPLKKVTEVITSNGGKIINQDVWGKRKLAYPIKKENFAVYVYFEIQLSPEAVSKVEGVFNITDEVIRYLITNPVPKFEEEESEEKEEDQKESKEDKDEELKKTAKDTNDKESEDEKSEGSK